MNDFISVAYFCELWRVLSVIARAILGHQPARRGHAGGIGAVGAVESVEPTSEGTISNMETVPVERGRQGPRTVEFHNLDAVIAVGYRVYSTKAA